MKKVILLFFSLCVIHFGEAQCTLLPNAVPGLALVHTSTNCFNNSGVAYNPILGLYYGVRAGNPGFPLETWNSAGVSLNLTTAGFDWRGMWWNPATNQLEGNGYNTSGMWKADLNVSGYALNTGVSLFAGMSQPDPQSCGDLDCDANEVLYYFNGNISRYSRATNAFLGSYPITGTPVALANLNSTTLMYTGCLGMEIALLDYVNKRVYVYDKSTGAYVGTSQLPATAVTTTSFRTSWANCNVWLFDLTTYTWFSYSIFSGCSLACTACPPVFTTQNFALCAGDSVQVQGNWYYSSITLTDTLATTAGCDSIITYNIVQATALSVSPTLVNNASCGLANGSATVTASGGFVGSGYAFSWLPSGGSAATAVGLGVNTYTVTVTDSNSCTASTIISILNSGAPTVTVTSQTNVLCFGASTGSATASAVGATPPYDYVWTNSSSVTVHTDNNIITPSTAPGLPAGTYTITVTDANGCTTTTTVTITQPASALTLVSGAVTNATCGLNNGSASVVASGGTVGAGYIYSWAPSGGSASSSSSLGANTYTVTVTDANNCTATATIVITNSGGVNVSITSQVNVNCFGASTGSATATATGGSGVYSYSWIGSSSTTSTATGLSAGTYTVNVNDGTCTGTATVTITQNTAITASVTTTSSACAGATGSATVSASGGSGSYTYIWTIGGSSSTILNIPPGAVSVTVTDGLGCTGVGLGNVGSIGGPTANAGPDVLILAGENTILNGTNSAGCNYSWTPSSYLNVANSAIVIASPPVTTTYVLHIVCGGCSDTDEVTVFVEEDCGDLFVPDAFSPNGDGDNDLLFVYGNCIGNMNFVIYDRWGEIVWETDLQSLGWDGSYKGKILDTGVFVWYLNAVVKGENVNIHGNVLIKR